MLLTPITPSTVSVSGPEALHSRITISVEAGAVAMAMEPSSREACQLWPSASIAVLTRIAASRDSARVTRSTLSPTVCTRWRSKMDPTENRINPRATWLKTLRVVRFS